jgi:hypothetical protein
MNGFYRTLLVVATAASLFVGLAEAEAKKVEKKKAPPKPVAAEVQKEEAPAEKPCPAGCTPGRKSGLKEQLFSKCPDNCRPLE